LRDSVPYSVDAVGDSIVNKPFGVRLLAHLDRHVNFIYDALLLLDQKELVFVITVAKSEKDGRNGSRFG